MDVPVHIVESALRDLTKRQMDKFERASLIKAYLKETGKSQRQLARDIGASHGWVQDCLLWDADRVERAKYDEMKAGGHTETEMYRLMRSMRGKARHGEAWIGRAWRRTARQGTARRGLAWHGSAWRGRARQGFFLFFTKQI